MCKKHSDESANAHVNELIQTIRKTGQEAQHEQCQEMVEEKIKPRWVDHTDLDCEPIGIMEILNKQGEYQPCATLVLRSEPMSSTKALHYRVDYTLRVPSRQSVATRFLRRRSRLLMGHIRGFEPETIMEMAKRGLAQIIYLEANQEITEAIQKGKILPH